MRWFLFPVAVVATSIALVAATAAVFVLPVRAALASELGVGGGPVRGSGFVIPSQLQGLAGLPADQRFSHFEGVQISLKDKDNQPLTIAVTPGIVTAASATSVTIAANDGTAKTFALDSQTMIRGKGSADKGPTASGAVANGQKVAVVTLNGNTTATAVVDAEGHGFGPPWGHGPGGPFGSRN